jgi:hypothetical protein
MMSKLHYWIIPILVGYLIGYYWRGLGNMTIGKLVGSK